MVGRLHVRTGETIQRFGVSQEGIRCFGGKYSKRVGLVGYHEFFQRKTLNHGTTTACYFATLFKEASLVLVDSVIEHGQRALVGKVNMTQSSYADYVETEEEMIQNTVAFIGDVKRRRQV